MQRSPGPGKTPDLSDSVHQQLNMYALAAGAAGVGMLASVQPVEARVIYTPAHRVIMQGGHYLLDLNHDGRADFNLSNYYNCGTDFCAIHLYALPAAGNAVEGINGPLGLPQGCDPNDSMIAYALIRGSRVGPKASFCGGMMANVGWLATYGKWWNVNNRYLGLKFQIKGKVHYGWARLSVKGSGLKITATLTGYAYETIPGKAIMAGKTHGPEDTEQPVPAPFKTHIAEPGTLGVFALGSSGMSIWRREEPVAAALGSN